VGRFVRGPCFVVALDLIRFSVVAFLSFNGCRDVLAHSLSLFLLPSFCLPTEARLLLVSFPCSFRTSSALFDQITFLHSLFLNNESSARLRNKAREQQTDRPQSSLRSNPSCSPLPFTPQPATMSSSTLQLLPTTATEIAQLDPATLASIPGVAYDLKRLKVYSSCLRCRAKKVKCDRKEPCSRCEKHNVECSYRELASVQLDIRQFQRHLTNPKIRKDGAGIITSTATPIITLPSGDTAVLAPSTTAAATLIAAAKATALSSSERKHSSERKSKSSASTTSVPHSPVEPITPRKNAFESTSSTDTESDTPTRSNKSLLARARVHKIHRRKHAAKLAKKDHRPDYGKIRFIPSIENDEQDNSDYDEDDDDDDDDDEEIERVVLRDDGDPDRRSVSFSRMRHTSTTDVHMASDSEDEDEDPNVPIWRAQAVGKHKQTAHEQELAETFGFAAYLKAKEMVGEAIDYDIELERALAQRMPTSFSRPGRSLSRARKYAQAGYSPTMSYAHPAYCQLSSLSNSSQLPPVVHCCCQIAARYGQAPGTCFFGNGNNTSTNLNSNVRGSSHEESSMSPPPMTIGYEQGEATRIAYSPSYQPSYALKDSKDEVHRAAAALAGVSVRSDSSSSSTMMPPPPPRPLSTVADASTTSAASPPASPRVELPPIYLPKLPPYPTTPASSDLSRFQVGRDNGDKPPLEIACKYNEPNVDAWDMIEKPLSRSVPVTTKKSRPVKMEMGWILS